MDTSLEAKIVVLGAQGVGKTSLVHRFVRNHFTPPSMMTSTVGASFLTKRVVDIDSQAVVRLQIWDTAGQERFRSITKLYYRGANAAVLCYDITSAASFVEMSHWLTELRSTLPEDTILHVVGTKSDIVADNPTLREVPFERCIAYIAENLYPTAVGGASSTMHHPGSHAGGSAPDYFSSTAPDSRPAPTNPRGKLASNMLGHKSSKNVPMLYQGDEPLTSPNSNRSSAGFWGQDLGWDCCHEVSASSGEGVEEVFRVITRRLVEQRNNRLILEARNGVDFAGQTPGLDERTSYFGDHSHASELRHNANGSFRVGYGDKRRSWLGLPTFPSISGEEGATDDNRTAAQQRRSGCC